jgi:DNA repair protein SbcC/Rad50
MRPLELSIEGFTSFRHEQHLDFSELDLFAITGATGAGKSSLLDAMTYALFGTTNRSGKQVSDLVSQGSENLKVQLRFTVGSEQYRVTRRWRYRPKSPENKVILESWQNGDWETLGTSIVAVQNTIEQILGMGFDTFTRAIILPQGKFDEFIKGDTSKRREILRQLAGFEIFELMRKESSELAKLLKQEREMVERQLAQLSVPVVDEVTKRRSQLLSLEQSLPQLEQAMMTAQKALDEEEQLFLQITRWEDLQQQLSQLKANSPGIKILTERLEMSQIANRLQVDWALVKQIRGQYIADESAAKLAQDQLIKADLELAAQQQQLDSAKARKKEVTLQIKAREDALATAKVYDEQRRELEKEVAIVQKNVQEKFRYLKAAEKELETANNKMQVAGFRATKAVALMEQYSAGGKPLEQLQQAAPLLMEFQLTQKQAKNQQEQLNKIVIDREEFQHNYTQISRKLEVAEVRLKECCEELEVTQAANVEAARLDSVAAVRISLNSGDMCPVCGGLHPESNRLPPLSTSTIVDITPLREEISTANQVFQVIQLSVVEAKSALYTLHEKESEIAQILKETLNRVSELQQQITLILDKSQWEASQLQQELVMLKESDRLYRETEQNFQQVALEYDKSQQIFTFASATQVAKQEEYQNAIAELDRRQQQLRICVNALYQITEDRPYDNLEKSLEQDKQNLESFLEFAENNYQNAHKNTIQATEINKQATNILEQTITKKQQINQDWQSKLTVNSFIEETFVAAIVPATKQSTWESTIREYRESKIQLETREKDLSEVISGKTTDENIVAKVQSEKHTAQENFKQANNNRAELLVWIQVAEYNLEQAERLSHQITNFTEQEQTYHTLAQNLKSNEFQSYILEHLEAELVGSATLILQELTENRYALKIQEGEYWVADNWNGGEARRVRTLSGGETFATSLSMALALSEKLSQGAQLGSLFLDEGFGTLDAETLESVTQILESLRQKDRLIGVITHVRGLGERLPAQVKVFKSPQGSRIEIEKV